MYSYPYLGKEWSSIPPGVSFMTRIPEYTLIENDKVLVAHQETRRIHPQSYQESVQERGVKKKSMVSPLQLQEGDFVVHPIYFGVTGTPDTTLRRSALSVYVMFPYLNHVRKERMTLIYDVKNLDHPHTQQTRVSGT